MFSVLRIGTAGTVIAVGPLADEVVEATLGLDVTVLYAAASLRASIVGFLDV